MFGTIDSRSAKEIFAYELFTVIDLIRINFTDPEVVKINSLPYKRELKPEDRNLAILLQNLANSLDSKKIPTFNKKELLSKNPDGSLK